MENMISIYMNITLDLQMFMLHGTPFVCIHCFEIVVPFQSLMRLRSVNYCNFPKADKAQVQGLHELLFVRKDAVHADTSKHTVSDLWKLGTTNCLWLVPVDDCHSSVVAAVVWVQGKRRNEYQQAFPPNGGAPPWNSHMGKGHCSHKFTLPKGFA